MNAIVNNSPTQPFVYGSTIDLKTKKMIQQWHPEKVSEVKYSTVFMRNPKSTSRLKISLNCVVFRTQGFTAPHDIACDSSGKIVYVAEITSPGRLWKLEEETERMN